MRKTYPFLIAGLVVVAIVAPMAQGTGRADRVAALEKKVKTLTTRLNAVESQASAMRSDVAKAKDDIAAAQAALQTLQSGGATLQSAVTALQTNVGSLTTSVQCVRYKTMPVTRYMGYLYTPNGSTLGVTTALDVTDSGTPQAYAALVNPSCVSASFAVWPTVAAHSSVAKFNPR